MKLIQLSDIHLTAPGATIGGRDPRRNFERALAHVLRDHHDAELMVITGDLSDWGDRDDYLWLRTTLDAFPIPTRLCIGNHDRRDVFLGVFPEYDDGGFVQGMHDVSAGRCLFLDTVEPNTHAGRYCDARQVWLQRQLTGHPGPFLLFMHHHPMPTHLGPMDRIGLSDGAAFRSIVGAHRNRIRHVFFGHCHLPLAGSIGGVPTSSLRGTNHASFPLFSETAMLSASDLPQSYGVCFVGADYVTVHMVEFGYDGPIRVEGSPEYTAWDRETMVR
ncbi:Metallophosphoesterase [Rhodopseudomonas palustris HaA2]|uniref:Metallophosphoesterase n=1 Tax=Rhodopseudomonas palustris (strain HaA2) TaxID=316058 RepID=Q2J3S5_RHOP2|nr:phosphodiesterase [Rhodopseudomonas palustris]ABD04885.1 Metallophosphoesterase [Rhodopseudomonas palustris HaA2]